MATDSIEVIDQVPGEEIRPAVGKLWGMLLMFLLMIPIGAFMAYCWWFEVELFAGKVLTTKAGIVGLLAIPLAILLVIVMFGLLASAKQLILGDECLQLISRDRVVVHIPYHNITETYAKGGDGAGVVGMMLRDRNDPATLVPFWTKDRYEIQVMVYRKPLQQIHKSLNDRLTAFRARGK